MWMDTKIAQVVNYCDDELFICKLEFNDSLENDVRKSESKGRKLRTESANNEGQVQNTATGMYAKVPHFLQPPY